MQQYLQPTTVIDYNHPLVLEFVQKNKGNSNEVRGQAVNLYYAVRDGIRYDPYQTEISIKGLQASGTLQKGYGWCVSKAVLLAACCRAAGIPARLGYADIRNHLSTERLRQQMKTDIFYWHGYTAIYLNGNWIKATPAFNKQLCEKFRLKTLEFDGINDSILHPFDLEGNKHMEYLNFRGEYADLPLSEIEATFRIHYPHVANLQAADFNEDVEKEISRQQ